ncbi:MAG: SUF system NifU family Fe-S cluster assembly protein [Patescibacteria group bacterium]
MDLYQANILDHYKHPRHKGKLKNATVLGEHNVPSCGDSLIIELQIDRGKIIDAAFNGEGCVLSQASASILLDEIIGKTVTQVLTWDKKKILDLLNIEIGPNRQKCATLSLDALKQALIRSN